MGVEWNLEIRVGDDVELSQTHFLANHGLVSSSVEFFHKRNDPKKG